jgi:tetraacyldisaccharide 4'-kinase
MSLRLKHSKLNEWFTQWVLAQWQKRGLLSYALYPLSLLSYCVARINRLMYQVSFKKPELLDRPVIVVGNVVVGGAGKTPVVIEVVKYLKSLGMHVGVISKGYGRELTDNPPFEVKPQTSARVCGDEPKLIFEKTLAPVFVGRSRVQTARALIEQYPHVDILVSDDGLHDLSLARVINLIVFNDSGVGNGLLLPAGPLREPWPLTYSGAVMDFILSTNQHKAPTGFKLKRTLSTHAFNKRGETLDLDGLRLDQGKRVHAIAGIARPEQFFHMLELLGVELAQTTYLPDHAQFDLNSLHDLFKPNTQPQSTEETIFLCTEKDAVKIWEFDESVWSVPLACELPNEFYEQLQDCLSAAMD